MFDLRTHTHLLTLAGSRAYGIHKPDSDVDVKGVAIPPRKYYLGYLQQFEQADKAEHMGVYLDLMPEELAPIIQATKLEGSIYELRKFVSLAADNNPNILDILFCRDSDIRMQTPIGARLRAARDSFLSAKAKHTFSGYAMAQLRRIRHHRAWLLNPPKNKPTRAQFSLPENTLIPADHLAAIRASTQKVLDGWNLNAIPLTVSDRTLLETHMQEFLEDFCKNLPEGLVTDADRVSGAKWLAAARHIGASDNLIWVLQKEREYEAAQRHWKQYQTWKQERNAERAEGEAKYGYDVKHGGHLVRLFRMGLEILKTGKVHVWRGTEEGGPGDADEIKAIRAGAWSYDQLLSWAEEQDKALTEVYTTKGYVVPHAPDRHAIDKMVVEILTEVLHEV